MTIRLGGMSRRSFLRTGTAFGVATGAAGLKMPALAQEGLPDIQATLDSISVEKYVREDYRKLYNMSNEPLWDPAKDWIRTVDWEAVRSQLGGTTVRFAIGAADQESAAEGLKPFEALSGIKVELVPIPDDSFYDKAIAEFVSALRCTSSICEKSSPGGKSEAVMPRLSATPSPVKSPGVSDSLGTTPGTRSGPDGDGGDTGDHFVDVHVRLRAAAGLPDEQRKVRVERTGDDFVRRLIERATRSPVAAARTLFSSSGRHTSPPCRRPWLLRPQRPGNGAQRFEPVAHRLGLEDLHHFAVDAVDDFLGAVDFQFELHPLVIFERRAGAAVAVGGDELARLVEVRAGGANIRRAARLAVPLAAEDRGAARVAFLWSLVYLALLFVAPALHELHFYLIHRAIHWGPLYRWIHSIHHNSINPSPISSLSMHPVEAFLYHAVALWHVLLPSNPVVALFQLHAAGFGAINGHIGFEKIELGGERCLASHAYLHHLHHKHFEVNYGGDGLIPLDKWFGTWHDGSKEGDAKMQARFDKKRARMNAQPNA